MYSTCLHCHKPLGRNEAVEHFPVGRRLAFDSAKGRLWVVCQHCARWNLTPIEERWEAVEESERAFRAQRLRAQTDNVGLVRLPDSTELIRIGQPLRPEFAAWRYGVVFRQHFRRRVALASGAGLIAGVAGVTLVGGMLGPSALFFAPVATMWATHLVRAGRDLRRTLAMIEVVGENGKPLSVSRAHLDHSRIVARPGEPVRLVLQHFTGIQELAGDRATRALSTLLARVNGAGGSAKTVSEAATMIADAGDPDSVIRRVADQSQRLANQGQKAVDLSRRYGPTDRAIDDAYREDMRRRHGNPDWPYAAQLQYDGALYRLPPSYRLALEMALHETSEQTALDQELALLERAWREAEEIAAIADGELTPMPPSPSERKPERK
jgi:hypothetical protein